MGSPDPLNSSGTVVILFDGVCNLCNGFVQFIIKRDQAKKFRFASLQSDFGKAQLIRFGLNPNMLHSVIVIQGDKCLERSDAVLFIASQLGGPWKIFSIAKIISRALRDAFYNLIAKRRYTIFGKQDNCMIPTPELKERFLD